jgi:predicted amidohydrolase
MDSGVFTAAAIQSAPVFLDRDATVDKTLTLIEQAAASGAKLVVFPETWIPGYPEWIFGTARWNDPPAKRLFARLRRNSVEVPSPVTDALCQAARRHEVVLVVGINERDAAFSTGTLYNSLLFISERGELLGVHRKIMPTHAERILWGQGDGSTLHVFDTVVGRLGGLCCWEHWMPLTRFAMHAKGEQVHVAAWPDLPEFNHIASRHYAFEGRCYVVAAGMVMAREDVPADFEAPEALGLSSSQPGRQILKGGSGIIAPDAKWIAGPAGGEETILYGEIDVARIAEEQLSLDTAGHYNRPDIFRLTVDETPRQQVSWIHPTAAAAVGSEAAQETPVPA